MAANVIISGALSYNTAEEAESALKMITKLNKEQELNKAEGAGLNVLTTDNIKPFESPYILSVDFEGSIPSSFWIATIDFLKVLLEDAVYYSEVNCYYEQEPVFVLNGSKAEN